MGHRITSCRNDCQIHHDLLTLGQDFGRRGLHVGLPCKLVTQGNGFCLRNPAPLGSGVRSRGNNRPSASGPSASFFHRRMNTLRQRHRWPGRGVTAVMQRGAPIGICPDDGRQRLPWRMREKGNPIPLSEGCHRAVIIALDGAGGAAPCGAKQRQDRGLDFITEPQVGAGRASRHRNRITRLQTRPDPFDTDRSICPPCWLWSW